MESRHPPTGKTRTEGSSEIRAVSAVLIHLGSAENGFANAGGTYPLGEVDKVRFGRALSPRELECEIEGGVLYLGIPLLWVSGMHADLEVKDDGFGFRLIDLNSRNGTRVEGESIQGHAVLAPGQVFEIGRSFWMVREETSAAEPGTESIRTVNPRLRAIHRNLDRLADGNLPVLLTGETGTGKDHLAHMIHAASGRRGQLVEANVAAGPVDRVLLGSQGALEQSRGGTLFLNEVGELPDHEQTRLLLALMSHSQRVRGEADGVRLISASTRDVRSMVTTETFRPDLYARLAAYEARLLPLRERREDLGLMTRMFARTKAGEKGRVTTAAFRRMLAHDWPFNVRELEQTIAASLAFGEPAGVVTEQALRDVMQDEVTQQTSPARIQAVREELLQQLIANAGNIEAVATSLQCETSDIEAWLERFQIKPKHYAQ